MVCAKLDNITMMAMDVKEHLKDHERRITALEHTAVQARLLAIVTGMLAGVLGPKLTALIGIKP